MEQLIKIIFAMLFTPAPKNRWGIPVLLWGEPGIGKSSIVEQIAMSVGLQANTFIASLSEPSDIAMPVPIDGKIKMVLHEQFEALMHSKDSITHFDELTQASGPMQGAVMRIINDAVVGNKTLPTGARRIASANDESQAAGGNPLAAPLNNRFVHINVDDILMGETQSWIDWVWDDAGEKMNFLKTTVKEEEERVWALWPAAFLAAQRDFTAFIRRKPDQLQHKIDESSNRKAWPTRRSVATAMRIWASSKVHNLDDRSTALLLEGCVGEGFVNEFIPFVTNDPLPDPAELLDGNDPWEHVSHRPDRTLAVIDSCTALVCPKGGVRETRTKRAKALWLLMAKIARQDPTAGDLFEPAARKLMEAGLWTNTLRKSAEGLLSELAPIITAAKKAKGKL